MLTEAREVTLVISDLHMGEGAESVLEDFKRHPAKRPFQDTSEDRVLDDQFDDFIKLVMRTGAGKKVCLRFLGDTFDPLAVTLDRPLPVLSREEDDLEKFVKIVGGHPIFFRALKDYCCASSEFETVFHIGNHDLFLCWPSIQAAIRALVSPAHPERVRFVYDELDRGVYFRHGESEPHDFIDSARLIIKQADFVQLFKSENVEKLIQKGEIPSYDVLNVPLGHFLTADLETPLKRANYLIGRLHIHGFVWLDACRNFGRRSWYSHPWFGFIAFYHLLRTIFKHTLFAVRPLKWKSGLRKILEVVWWTIVGILTDATPRDKAMKVFKERPEVDVVVFGHEHWYYQETHSYPSKTYINTGAWMELWKARPRPISRRWEKYPILAEVMTFLRDCYRDANLAPVRLFPVAVISYNAVGERQARLMRFDEDEHILKELN